MKLDGWNSIYIEPFQVLSHQVVRPYFEDV